MRYTNRRAASSGFSLIELMVVITIIGILGAFVGTNVWTAMKKANITTTRAQMKQIENDIKRFKLDKRRLPDSLDELVPDYLDSDVVPRDSWGNEYIYSKEGRSEFVLTSLGADGVEGGEEEDADITREDLRRSGPDEADSSE